MGLTDGCALHMTASMNDTPENVPAEAAVPSHEEAAPAHSAAAEKAPPAKPRKEKKEDSFPVFLIKLVLIVAFFRSFVFSPFNIPSESMLPRLENGDYLLAAKWPFGYSKYSLPFSSPLLPFRIFSNQLARGDVVIF